jgi:hypothetical protein
VTDDWSHWLFIGLFIIGALFLLACCAYSSILERIERRVDEWEELAQRDRER